MLAPKYPEPLAPWPPAPRRRIATVTSVPDEERFTARLRRRVRDLMIMGIVGPSLGIIAIASIHVATARHPVVASATHAAHVAAIPRAVTVPLVSNIPAEPPAPPALTEADFGDVTPTPDARHMADWVVGRHDNGRMPFFILDKRAARLYVFHPNGELVEDTPVLLGAAHGDDTYPGIGNVPIAQVKPYQRTTAAGRFVTQPGLDIDRTDVVWLDYDAALALHRVINKVKSERRLQRLASPDPTQRRISWGCINIPIDFFDRNISPVFGKRPGVAYVIPERKTFAQVFEQPGSGAPVLASATLTQAKAPMDVGSR